ncbi:histidine kinase [Gordoniibacillus kamchatkensis]|uniref:Oxygen sensor histidine kinase NreB n=1 Tax=Gordoniibacillus kamchatkensis TaxID=1590651 RepID=A0ABR5ALF1_9BACL|nr:HAMP domain-containing sensor histidine kinase [Paenibacillus sp. VKM B-2647]KIL41882.1 histidine kinase [Paenibacillus sp. VKM B-2647]
MLQRIREFNMKWRLMVYFLTASLLSLACLFAAYQYYQAELGRIDVLLGVVAAVVLIGQAVGYAAAKWLQRKLDSLHLALLELSKGNFTRRIPVEQGDPFRHIFGEFNRMARSLGERMQLLQKLGGDSALAEFAQVEAAVMEERRRLARDLHDTVSQELFAIHMSASSLPKVLERNPDTAAGLMEQLIRMSHHAQKQMRGLISQLRPIELDGKSLQAALETWFPEYCRASDLQGLLDCQVSEELPEALEQQLFLIIQESMANIVKHAAATQVELQLQDTGHQYVLLVQDNGKGFAKSELPSTSHGLATMRERAQKLGGEVEIVSRLGTGTTVRVRIPKFASAPSKADEAANRSKTAGGTAEQ